MSDIILGTNFKLYYNTDTGNSSPQGVNNVQIHELAEFPVLSISSETTSFDTYDSDYISKLLSDMTVSDMNIVVNYIATDPTHKFLDNAVLNQTEFQLVLVYSINNESNEVSYAIVNGHLTASSLSGDKDSVVQKNYNFTNSQVIARSMSAKALNPLYEGDFGVGSNGTTTPQYSPEVPTGNSFIKIPAAQTDNPASADMMGVGWTDNGQVCEFAVTKSGALGIYAKNASTAWTRIYTVSQSDAAYVSLTGNQSIAGNKTFTGTTVHSGATTLTGTTTAGVVNAGSLSLTTALPIASGGTGAKTAAQAAINLKVVPYNGAVTTAVDINDYGITDAYVGYWQFSATAGYASANLPEASGGILEVIRGGDYGGMQKYTSITGYVWIRTLTASWNATTKPWGDWKPAGYQATKAYTADLNSLTVANLYSCNASTLNTPTGITVGGWCFHYSHAATGNYLQVYVTATTSNNAQVNRTFQRTYNGTTWTAWAESYTTLNKPSATDVGALPIVAGFSDVDVNNIVTAGVYSCTSVSPNIPAVITGTMEVYVRQGGLSITQIYHCNATSTGFQNRHYIRTGTISGSTTTWTSWNSLTLTTTNVATGTDLNTILSSGRYYGSFINSPTGSANSASAILDVTNTGGDTLVVQSLTFTTANVTWTRRLITATWSDWVQVYASNAKPSIADLGIDTYVKSYGLGVNSTTSPNYVYYPATSTNISDTRFINALSTDDQATTQQPVAGQEFGGLNVQRGLRPAQFGVSGRGSAASFWFRGYTGASATQSDWIQAFPSTGGTLTGALNGTTATFSGALNGTTGTFTGAVQQRENNITYRQLISRSDAFSPYTVYNRLDQVEGTPPTAITSIGDITGRLTTTGGDPYAGRLVGGLSFQRNVDDTGRVVLNARNLTGGITSSIVLDGGQSSVAITGTLQAGNISATGTIERAGSGTLGFNANRTNAAVNSFYGAQTTAGQIFFGTASGNNFVVNNTQNNTGAWLTIDSSTAAFTTAVTVPSLTITNNLPITSGGTGAATAAAARTNLGLAYGTAAGTVAQGNDTRLNTVDGKTGGTITGNTIITGTFATTDNISTSKNFTAAYIKSNSSIDASSAISGSTFISTVGRIDLNGSNDPNATQGYISFNNAAGTQYSAFYSERAGDTTLMVDGHGSPKYFQFAKSGNFVAGGTVTCSSVIQTSDRDKKTDIINIPNALDKVNSINGVTFNWKDSGLPSAGIIAQELKEVLPECVSTVYDNGEGRNDDGVLEAGLTDLVNRSYAVEYSGVVALAIEAIKELSSKVESLEARLKSLENK